MSATAAITYEQALAADSGTCLECLARCAPGALVVDHHPDCSHAGGLGHAQGDERCTGPCGRDLEPGEPYVLAGVDRIAAGTHQPGLTYRGDERGDVTCLDCAAITPTREDETP